MSKYTTQLQAGLGLVPETIALLELWSPSMSPSQLTDAALSSGQFPNVSARRLRNIVSECFAPRLLVGKPQPAEWLRLIVPIVDSRSIHQLLFIFACRANRILADFVRQVYWPAYSSGNNQIEREAAREFVVGANQDGLTHSYWAESTVRRVSSYLIGACRDFKLLESTGGKKVEINVIRIEPTVTVILAYLLHVSNLGDNQVLAHEDWELFGLDRTDVLAELQNLSKQGHFIVQSAAGISDISWKYQSMSELIDVIANQ